MRHRYILVGVAHRKQVDHGVHPDGTVHYKPGVGNPSCTDSESSDLHHIQVVYSTDVGLYYTGHHNFHIVDSRYFEADSAEIVLDSEHSRRVRNMAVLYCSQDTRMGLRDLAIGSHPEYALGKELGRFEYTTQYNQSAGRCALGCYSKNSKTCQCDSQKLCRANIDDKMSATIELGSILIFTSMKLDA